MCHYALQLAPATKIVIASVLTNILLCQYVPKKSAILACLIMAKLKMNQHVPNKNDDLLKQISLIRTQVIA